jgi:1-acyl-sn-glycerol-3-phosphate acyltransferase
VSKARSAATKLFRIVGRGIPLAFFIFGAFIDLVWRALGRRLDETTRAAVLQKWCKRVANALRLQVTTEGPLHSSGLIVSNHLSYLDVLAFSIACQSCFVSKMEVRSWPLVGWAAHLAGTIFIDRSRAAATHEIQPEMEAALAAGVRLVLFPEGTSSSGEGLLPFRSSLLQPAIDLNAPITAAAISYTLPEGDPAQEVCYWGAMTLAPHLLHLLTKEQILAHLRFAPQQLRFQDRKEAARALQLVIEGLRLPPTPAAKPEPGAIRSL